MSIRHLLMISSIASALTIAEAQANYLDESKKLQPKSYTTKFETPLPAPSIKLKDGSQQLDDSNWILWKKEIESRLDSDLYRKYSQPLTSDYTTKCLIDFTIEKDGKISDIDVMTDSSNNMFNTLAQASVKNLDKPSPISFPVDSKIDKLRLTGRFVLPRKLLHPWAINEF